MKKEIILLRISYLVAAIADFGIAILVLIPERMGVTEILYPMGLMSAVAFSWGILLLFANFKPIERRWILIPTIIVVSLLSITRLIFSISGTLPFSPSFLIFGLALVVFMCYSYYKTSKTII